MFPQFRVYVVEITDDSFETIILLNASPQSLQSLVARFSEEATQPLPPGPSRQTDRALMT